MYLSFPVATNKSDAIDLLTDRSNLVPILNEIETKGIEVREKTQLARETIKSLRQEIAV